MCRNAGWRGAAVRDSDDGPAGAAEAREDLRTYRPRPCRRNEPTHRTEREAESHNKTQCCTRKSDSVEKEEERRRARLKFAGIFARNYQKHCKVVLPRVKRVFKSGARAMRRGEYSQQSASD